MGFISKPIFAQLAKRFSVRQAGVEQLESGQVLVPVTNADELVRSVKLAQTTGSTTARNDDYTVPLGKTWYILVISMSRSNTGVNSMQPTIDGVLFDLNQGSGTFLAWDKYPLRVKQGDTIRCAFASGTSGPLTSSIYYLEEDS